MKSRQWHRSEGQSPKKKHSKLVSERLLCSSGTTGLRAHNVSQLKYLKPRYLGKSYGLTPSVTITPINSLIAKQFISVAFFKQ